MKRMNFNLLLFIVSFALFSVSSEIISFPLPEESSCVTPPEGMVSWWGGDSDALDLKSANHGSPMNGATYNLGRVDYSFWFDGSNDYVKTNDSPDWDLGSNDFTIDAWINTDNPNGTMRLASAGSQEDGAYNLWAFGYGANPVWGSGNRLNFCYFNGYGYADFNSNELTIAPNTWYHIAVVRSGTQIIFYLNGLNVGTAYIGNVSLGGGNTGLIIGARYYFNPSVVIEYAKGFIDEVEIFNRALNQAEIQTIYNAGSFGKCKQQSGTCITPPSGMVAWWAGDYNALDMAGGHNGFLENGAYFTQGKVNQTFGLDGVNDYIKTNDSPNWDLGNSNFTIDAWINTCTPNTTMRLISAGSEADGAMNLWAFGYGTNIHWGNGFRLNFAYYDAEGYPYSDFNSNEIYIQENTWYHIAVVRSGTELIFYFNGSYVGAATIGNVSLGGGSAGLLIGARYGTNPLDIIEFAQGFIDEVELFNRALSHDEILQIYKAGGEGKCRPCATPPSGMVSWWKAENNAEDSIGTNNGTLMNGATFTSGMVSQSFSFDGMDDYVAVTLSPDFPSGSSARTIDAWFKTNAEKAQEIIHYGVPNLYKSVYLVVDNTSDCAPSSNPPYAGYKVLVGTWGAGANLCGTTQVNDGQWHHVAATFDGTKWKLYLDGNLENETTAIPTNTENDLSMAIGNTKPGSQPPHNYAFNGLIDEVEVFNRALTDEEILAIYNARSAGKCQSFPLQVAKTGNGIGRVVSNPSGLDCGTMCSYDFPVYRNLVLTAEVDTNSFFSGWGGDCAPCGTNAECNIFMNSAKNCIASFSLRPPSEASGSNNLMSATKGVGTSIDISYTISNCATDHAVYWGQGPIVGGLNWINSECGFGNSGYASFDPGDPPQGSFIYFVVVGNNGYEEGSYGKNSSGIERPEATRFSLCDWPQVLSNACN